MTMSPRLRGAVLVATMAFAGAAVQAQELVVSAAASLTNAFQAVGAAFEQSRPGAKVIFNFAASGPLLAQIQQGAPVDVFASADQETMNKAASLIAAPTRADFAANTLVLILPSSSIQAPKAMAELASPSFRRLSTGTPATVPVGRYTMAVVQKAGLAVALQPKWIFGESVRQVLNYVARGEVDAGFVYRTDAIIERDKTRIAFTVPTPTPVTYPIAQVAASKKPALANEFIAFVRGESGQKILQRFGFSQP